ncbi:uncharacterized protein G2W53_038478 [Senna tora]|uniref:Uncharacterized protein n=1 Tax=Senna tora TaxID=362788 RepID=A0A834W1Z2_9FABA|nr:uncharacterized protein G2W53_038478 [Senna tora]
MDPTTQSSIVHTIANQFGGWGWG